MAVTTTTSLTNSYKVLFNKEFQMAATGDEFYDQLSWVKEAMGVRRGSSVDWPIIESLDIATSTLSQTSDVTPVALADSNATVTISEYGELVAAF